MSRRVQGVKSVCVAFLAGVSLAWLTTPMAKELIVALARSFNRPVPDQQPMVALAKTAKQEPWGRLEAFELPFANPTGAYPDRQARLQGARWFFEGATFSSVERFIETCDLPRLHRRVLLDKRYWKAETNGCTISPPPQLIWFLTPTSREQIYTLLGKWPENYPQALPFHFSDRGFELRLQSSGLPPSAIDMIERLTYRKWGDQCFSDLEAAEELLDPADFQSLLEAMYAIPAYTLRLHVDAASDVPALVKYWGKGGREKHIAPLLTALSKIPGGEAVNVMSMLPPFARLRLYTFPEAWEKTTASHQDCFYSALNFFNEIEDTNFLGPACIQRTLDTQYAPVTDSPTFGDLMVLMNPEAAPVHVCVYIADNFVFTKNGNNPGQPWVLMRLPDVLPTYFAPGKPGRILCLRQKEPSKT